MEKASIIFSVLIHSDEFMYLFWGILGFFNMILGSFLLMSKSLGEKELVEISPDFKNINSDYIVFSIFAIMLIITPILIMMSGLDKWALANYMRRFYPTFVFFFSGYGIYQALFAISKGVYPMGKILYFIYDDIKVIRRAAKIHIISSVVLFALSILVFFMTV
jgi:hypothetical protein